MTFGMTSGQLKVMMEEQWEKPGCSQPLGIARWWVGDFGSLVSRYGTLAPYQDPLALDQDDGGPGLPADPG